MRFIMELLIFILILNEKGILCFISSNKFMRARYGINLRKFLKNKTSIIKIIDFKEKHLFEAITNTLIFLARNDSIKGNKFFFGNDIGKDKNYFFQDDLKDSEWTLVDKKVLEIKNKLEKQGIFLKNWKNKINYGLKTGFNQAFVIDNETKEKLCLEGSKCEEILKPVLRGRDIFKWGYDWKGLWLIFLPWHFPLTDNPAIKSASKSAEREFIKNYPSIYKHLLKYKEKLSKRNKEETNIRYEWYVLQRYGSDYYHDFKKEKIIWIELSDENKFAYSRKGEFVLAGAFMMTGEHLKYLLCFLNSKLCKFYFKLICNSSGMDTVQWKKFAIERIPIKKISEKEEKKFVELADKMIYLMEKSRKSIEDDNIFDEIKNTENEINNLIYETNNLNGNDIRVIEEYLMNN